MTAALDRIVPQRYWSWIACIFLCAGFLWLAQAAAAWLWPAALFGFLSLVGLLDFTQEQQAIRRNYPVVAHLRFFLEYFRPEIRQYLLEADTDGLPFSREQRSIVYQRAKDVVDKRPFGTQLDVYEPHYEWINHSMAPADIASHDFRIAIGGPDCTKPYSASVFNISAMSFGALSANAILALNEGAKRGSFFHDTGEGSISRYHREHGGDLVWEIGSGYFGCRNAEGRFDEAKFAENARSDQVKMIEIKLSQGAKPGHGGVLPGAKVTPRDRRGARRAGRRRLHLAGTAFGVFDADRTAGSSSRACASCPAASRSASSSRSATRGNGSAIVKAMLETGITPDFIVVDGGEGGTGAAPLEFTDHVGAPLREGADAGAQHAGRHQPARPDLDRRVGQDHHRLRHRAHHRPRRRLVQFGARLHVRAGLHPGADLPHRPLPDRRHHAGPEAHARAGRARQGRARAATSIATR